MSELNPAAVRVSPFIRFNRWALLFAGIAYGTWRFNVLQRRENEHRAYIEKMKPEWMENKRKAKSLIDRAELLYLAEATGNKIPADFDKNYPPPSK